MHTRPAPRIHDLAGDTDGAVMLEFIILAPLLSYLFVAILFFHHHIDYAQDAVVRFRHLTWKHAVPGGDATGESDSEQNGFTPVLSIRNTIQVAPAANIGSGAGIGTLIAAERYYGGGAWTPYSRLHLPHDSYVASQQQVAYMPPNPWANMLGALGKFFGHRIGGGSGQIPPGYNESWEERFPMICDPWQRYLDRGDLTELAITKAGGVGGLSAASVVMWTMNGLTLFRANTFLLDVHKVDSALDSETRENSLSTQSYSGSTRNKIFK